MNNMWLETQNGKVINLDNADTIEINPFFSIICKFGEKAIVLGSYSSQQKAENALRFIKGSNVSKIPLDSDV